MAVEDRIAELVEPSLDGAGYTLVRVQYNREVLQIMAERQDEAEMTIDDCTELSYTLSAVLDVADPIKEHYTLEISSPGLDRPLVRLSDYERFAGHPARIDLIAPLDGRKRFSGILRGAHGDAARLQLDDDVIVELPLSDISRARLDISSQLLKPQPKKSQKTKPRREKP